MYQAYGDCCSHSYIESIDDLEVLQDCTMLSMESVSGDTIDITDYEVHKWTFYKFKTTKG